jgi:hypothetical protein
MTTKTDISNANFVRLWYSSSVNTIDDFITGANADPKIDFTNREWVVKTVLNDEGNEVVLTQPHKDDCVAVRNKILSLVIGGTAKDRLNPKYMPRMGKDYAVFTSRSKYGAKTAPSPDMIGESTPPKWHARKLELESKGYGGTRAFSKSIFDDIIDSTFKPNWGPEGKV